MTRITQLLLLPLLLAGATSFASDIDITGVLTEESSTYNPDRGSSLNQITAAYPQGRFDLDFSTREDVEIKVTWKAPPGKLIEIATPLPYDYIIINPILEGGTENVRDGEILKNDLRMEFEGLDGVLPIGPFTAQLSGPPSGDRPFFYFSGFLRMLAGESIRFKSMSSITTVPSSYDVDFNQVAILEFGLSASATPTFALPNGDPGQWMRLIDDPNAGQEKAAERASIQKQIRSLERKIRKAKQQQDRRKASKLNRKLRKLKQKFRNL